MICLDCGISAVEYTGNLTLHNRTIGDFTVSDATYQECPRCGEQFFSPKTLDSIEATEKEIKEYRLSQYPIAAFIGATEAAEMLNISRQALHQHRRIRRGFIYSVRFGGKIAYLKESVELYRDTGDGRFILAHPYTTEQPVYLKEIGIPSTETALTEPIKIEDLGKQPRWQQVAETFAEFDFISLSSQSVSLNTH